MAEVVQKTLDNAMRELQKRPRTCAIMMAKSLHLSGRKAVQHEITIDGKKIKITAEIQP